MSTICGVDLSLNHTGVLVLKTPSFTVDLALEIKTPKKIRGIERLRFLRDEVCEVIYSRNVEIVVIEGYAYNARGTAHSTGEGGGVVKLGIVELGVPIVAVEPNVLKKFVTGKGKGPKALLIKEVYKKWKFDTASEHIADAYGLARFGYHYYDQSTEKMPKYLQTLMKDKGIQYYEPL